MTTLAQDIVNAAFARSFANRPETMAGNDTELLSELSRQMRDVYRLAARENPGFFGAIVNVPLTTANGVSGWARPANGVIYRLEAASDTKDAQNNSIVAGTPVWVVPFNDRALMAGTPAVYEFAQMFVGAGNTGDPASGSLNVFYSRNATLLSALNQALDSAWPEDFNPILIAGLAEYLADKDGRQDDAQTFGDEKASWGRTFTDFLHDATLNVVQRFGQYRARGRTATRAENGTGGS